MISWLIYSECSSWLSLQARLFHQLRSLVLITLHHEVRGCLFLILDFIKSTPTYQRGSMGTDSSNGELLRIPLPPQTPSLLSSHFLPSVCTKSKKADEGTAVIWVKIHPGQCDWTSLLPTSFTNTTSATEPWAQVAFWANTFSLFFLPFSLLSFLPPLSFAFETHFFFLEPRLVLNLCFSCLILPPCTTTPDSPTSFYPSKNPTVFTLGVGWFPLRSSRWASVSLSGRH